jgi:hypothetical protein
MKYAVWHFSNNKAVESAFWAFNFRESQLNNHQLTLCDFWHKKLVITVRCQQK